MTCVQGTFLSYLQGIKIHGKYNQAGGISGIGNDWVGIFFPVQILNAILETFCGTGSFLCGNRKCNRNKLPLLHHTFFYKLCLVFKKWPVPMLSSAVWQTGINYSVRMACKENGSDVTGLVWWGFFFSSG